MSAPTRNATELTPVHLVSLGCARNDVDTEELAARLELGGFQLTKDPEEAEAVLINTCGFVESAKKDSIDTVLAAADLKADGQARAVVAVGCLAERYGAELAEALPEADAVLGFDDYPDIAEKLREVLAGERPRAHQPRDRRALLPLTPVDRPSVGPPPPGHGRGPIPDLPPGIGPASGPPLRRRLSGAPWAPLKLASGCDRRCSFCVIPTFRGAYLSRSPADVLSEARWLASSGVREVLLVSENTSSYGKDLGDLRLLEKLLPELTAVEGLDRVRVSYLQPAEMRPGLIEVMTSTSGVAPYFDLSFQHAAPSVLRRMRRFGGTGSFLALLASIRAAAPEAGIRSNVIVGFPGESEADLDELRNFLIAAELDAVGVFGYSDEEGSEAATLDQKLSSEEISRRQIDLADLVEELMGQRAESRVGSTVEVLVDDVADGPVGRAAHQGPEVDGTTLITDAAHLRVGDLTRAVVASSDGADLVAIPAWGDWMSSND
jgi:ribosomal protein S12 methylthiotransferase